MDFLSYYLILFIIAFSGIIVFIEFFSFLFTGSGIVKNVLLKIVEIISLIILPFAYGIGNFNRTQDCCSEIAFSPDHQLSLLVLITLSLFSYFYSSYRKGIASPVFEIILNIFLLIGIMLNIVIGIHTNSFALALGGNVPIILLGIIMLVKNQRKLIVYSQEQKFNPKNTFEKFAWKILNLQPVWKYPVIFICCLPVIILLTTLLLIFGQKPDSMIRVFTDTYYHGLSQWDYKCENVSCGGHYLCSVAANGHNQIVRPQRLGIRNGAYIICNRQLLISNAFEELIQEKLPFIHKITRKHYNKIGNFVRRYYHFFNNKLVSDAVYFLMKPLEWFFLVTLYTFDKKPENRIAIQYLSKHDRQTLLKLSATAN